MPPTYRRLLGCIGRQNGALARTDGVSEKLVSSQSNRPAVKAYNASNGFAITSAPYLQRLEAPKVGKGPLGQADQTVPSHVPERMRDHTMHAMQQM